jgi:hypothetical protein
LYDLLDVLVFDLVGESAEIDIDLVLESFEELANDLGNHVLEPIGDLDLVGGFIGRGLSLLVLLGGVLNVVEEELGVFVLGLDVIENCVYLAEFDAPFIAEFVKKHSLYIFSGLIFLMVNNLSVKGEVLQDSSHFGLSDAFLESLEFALGYKAS